MTSLIAETAWHHEGDFQFMQDLIQRICVESPADIVKMHITLDLDEYMSQEHDAYELLKSWMLSPKQWEELIGIVRGHGKKLMLLLNDTKAIKFAAQFNPEFVELHSVCLNVPELQKAVLDNIDPVAKVVIGIGGCSLSEVDEAVRVFAKRDIIIMFGFQNYPTKYEDVNLSKVRKIMDLYSDRTFGYADHTGWDEPNNELITMLVAANGMSYVEKHITTTFGVERCDFSAAISIEMFSELAGKLQLLDRLYGNGSFQLNSGEKNYSKYGPMKMAAVANVDIEKGMPITINMLHFLRTKGFSDLSQIDALEAVGCKTRKKLFAGHVLMSGDFER